MSNCVFNINILAVVFFGILGGSQIYVIGPCAPRRPPSVKILKGAQVLANIYINVKKLRFRHELTANDTKNYKKVITHQHIA